MATTETTDVPTWIPSLIAPRVYDTMLEPALALSSFAETVPDLEGQAGSQVVVPVLGITTPAANLAETVSATDDELTGTGVTVTIKEAVKSIAFTDRVALQARPDINGLAGSRVGGSINDRIELDLGAAAVAGRNVAADTAAAALNVATFRTMRGKIPSALRNRGVALFAESAVLDGLFSDAAFTNAAALGSAVVNENGKITHYWGVDIYEVDASVLTVITALKSTALMVTKGTLVRAIQRGPRIESERDARARITRIVGTAFHGEGVIDSRGVVAGVIG